MENKSSKTSSTYPAASSSSEPVSSTQSAVSSRLNRRLITMPSNCAGSSTFPTDRSTYSSGSSTLKAVSRRFNRFRRLINVPGTSSTSTASSTKKSSNTVGHFDDVCDDSEYENIDDEEDILTKSTDNQRFLRVYTDGGKKVYRCGTVLCSIGVYFGQGHPDNVSRIVQSVQDSNVAEAKAVLEALNIASNNDKKKIKIFTDSQETIKIINSTKAQAIYRLKREKKPYSSITKGIKLYYKAPYTFDKIFQHINTFDDVQFIYVKGHSSVGTYGHDGNNAADKLASEALNVAAANAGLIFRA